MTLTAVFLRRPQGVASPRRQGEQKNEASWTPYFFHLTLFSLFLSFSRHFSSNMVSPHLALPCLRHRLKGKNGVNRHALPYRLKNYVWQISFSCIPVHTFCALFVIKPEMNPSCQQSRWNYMFLWSFTSGCIKQQNTKFYQLLQQTSNHSSIISLYPIWTIAHLF
jgi:hypothetical protein